MPDNSRAELHRFAKQLLDSFVSRMVGRYPAGMIPGAELQADAKVIEASPAFLKMLDSFHRRIVEEATRHITRLQRRDPFKRLIVHPMAPAFLEEYLTREILPNYFSFVHLVMGDEANELTQRCHEILDELNPGEVFDWDEFYHHPGAKLVLWTLLTRIANTFKRFDARRDWFISLMQHSPQAVSLASNAFMPLPTIEEKGQPFGIREFVILFECLFGPVRVFSDIDRKAFEAHFMTTPEEAFGALLGNIDALSHG